MTATEIRRSGTRDDPTITTAAAVEVGSGNLLEGYASVFDREYSVVDQMGRYSEIVRPGAFAASLREVRPVVQFNHGQCPSVGTVPIAELLTAREDTTGLFFAARLFDTPALAHLRAALEAGSVSGASFRFSVPPGGDRWKGTSSREIMRARVVELGPVVFGASPHASVALRTQLRKHASRTATTTPSISARARRYAMLYTAGVTTWSEIPADVRAELAAGASPRIAAAALAAGRTRR